MILRWSIAFILMNSLAFTAEAALKCDAVLESTVKESDSSSSQRALVVVPSVPQFKNIHDLSHLLERENVARLLDPRRAYFYYEPFLKRITPGARDAMDYYKGSGYIAINQHLRNKKLLAKDDHETRELLKSLDLLIDVSPRIPEGIVLFRGMSLSNPDSVNQPVGSIFTDPAFSSTSLSADVAARFIKRYQDPKTTASRFAIFQLIHVNHKSAKGLYIEYPGLALGGETEIVLDRDTKFRIIKSYPVEIEPENTPQLPGLSGFDGTIMPSFVEANSVAPLFPIYDTSSSLVPGFSSEPTSDDDPNQLLLFEKPKTQEWLQLPLFTSEEAPASWYKSPSVYEPSKEPMKILIQHVEIVP